MKLWRVRFKGKVWYAEAQTLEEACKAWVDEMRDCYGESFEGPDSLKVVHDAPVLRARES